MNDDTDCNSIKADFVVGTLAPSNLLPMDDKSNIDRLMEESTKSSNDDNNNISGNSVHNKALVQFALISSQTFFGVGSVVAALGLPKCNPFVFAMVREIAAAIILSFLALLSTRRQVQAQEKEDVSIWDHKLRFFCLGFAIFANQSCAIVGIKLAGPVASAVWQPSQPIITAAICILMRWEPINYLRILGISFAFLGCTAMVLLSSSTSTESDNDSQTIGREAGEEGQATMNFFQKEIIGNVFFFINCLGTSLYVILSKKPLQLFPSSLTVVATSYSVASICLIITCLGLYSYFVNYQEEVPFCPECTGFWNIPHNAYFALFYFIMFNSVGAYALITWANQYASGTLVMGYTVLQPVTAAILTFFLISFQLYPKCMPFDKHTSEQQNSACLDPPGLGTLCGMVGVFTGLFLIIKTEPRTTNTSLNSGETTYSNLATNEEEEEEEGNLELTPSHSAEEIDLHRRNQRLHPC